MEIKLYAGTQKTDKSTLYINGLLFGRTCWACPEQWDVFETTEEELETKDTLVGYVRLRHGQLSVNVPDVGGQEIYFTYDVRGDGIFDDDEERMKHLKSISQAIGDWIHMQKSAGKKYTSARDPVEDMF